MENEIKRDKKRQNNHLEGIVMNITDVAPIAGMNAAYFIDSNKLKKWVSGRHRISTLTLPAEFVNPPRAIATAPDENGIVVICDSTIWGNVVWRSDDGGATWVNWGTPMPSSALVTDIMITPSFNPSIERYIMVTLADIRHNNCQLGAMIKSKQPDRWTSIQPPFLDLDPVFNLNVCDFMAIQPSPHFVDDGTFCSVGVGELGAIILYVVPPRYAISAKRVYLTLLGGRNLDFSVPVLDSTAVHIDLALSPQFDGRDETTQVAFVSVTDNQLQANDGLYRVNNNTVTKLNLPQLLAPVSLDARYRIRSIDYANNVLLLGTVDPLLIAYSNNPSAVSLNWNISSIPNDCGENAVVRFGTFPVCYAGTGEYCNPTLPRPPAFPPRPSVRSHGAFLRSNDGGVSFS
jgi:hypothetical protein